MSLKKNIFFFHIACFIYFFSLMCPGQLCYQVHFAVVFLSILIPFFALCDVNGLLFRNVHISVVHNLDLLVLKLQVFFFLKVMSFL